MNLGNLNSYKIFVRDLELEWQNGSGSHQLLLEAVLTVVLPPDFAADRYKFVVCYDRVVTGAKEIAANGGHPDLAGLCEAVVEHCLADHRVSAVSVEANPATRRDGGFGGMTVSRARPSASDGVEPALKLVAGR